jgi:ParB family transcriptional regulator, chromosome partitioning protein
MSGPKRERRGLGRGLSALMADAQLSEEADRAAPSAATSTLPIEAIVPNPDQPRRDFSEADLESLAASIRQRGVLQPLIVRALSGETGRYQIVAGERRWRAAQRAQVHSVPVVVRDLTDTEVLEIAIIENIQRADLNAVEEAQGYKQLMERFGHTQEKVAEALGRSRSHIANLLRLLTLPDDVQWLLRDGALSAGHARALVTAENASLLAKQVVSGGLSVRETERLAKEAQGAKAPNAGSPAARPVEKDADTRALEADLSATMGMKVTIDHSQGQEHGNVTIRYRDLEELDTLCQRLSGFS